MVTIYRAIASACFATPHQSLHLRGKFDEPCDGKNALAPCHLVLIETDARGGILLSLILFPTPCSQLARPSRVRNETLKTRPVGARTPVWGRRRGGREELEFHVTGAPNAWNGARCLLRLVAPRAPAGRRGYMSRCRFRLGPFAYRQCKSAQLQLQVVQDVFQRKYQVCISSKLLVFHTDSNFPTDHHSRMTEPCHLTRATRATKKNRSRVLPCGISYSRPSRRRGTNITLSPTNCACPRPCWTPPSKFSATGSRACPLQKPSKLSGLHMSLSNRAWNIIGC